MSSSGWFIGDSLGTPSDWHTSLCLTWMEILFTHAWIKHWRMSQQFFVFISSGQFWMHQQQMTAALRLFRRICIYTPMKSRISEKLVFFATCLHHFEMCPANLVVVAGDFNSLLAEINWRRIFYSTRSNRQWRSLRFGHRLFLPYANVFHKKRCRLNWCPPSPSQPWL